jgi:Glutamyl-tRNAGlu reductase, dimerisation domain
LAVETLTRGIISKIMHTPISTLKTAVSQPEATTVVDIVRRLFDLQDKNLQDKNLQDQNLQDQNLQDKKDLRDKKKEDDKKTAKSSAGDPGAKT